MHVTQAAVAADVGEALDVTGNLAAQVAFDLHRVDRFAQLVFVFAREVFHPYVGADARLRKQLLRRRKTDAEDVREGDLDALVARKIDAGNTRH